MTDIDTLKQAIRELEEAAPMLPARVTALVEEGLSLRAAGAEFLQRIEERQAEAAELSSRLDEALGTLRREAAAAALKVAHAPDAEAALDDPALSFEERLFAFCVSVADRQEQAMEKLSALWTAQADADRAALEAGRLQEPLTDPRERLEAAYEAAVVEGAGYQGELSAAAQAVGGDVGAVASELEARRTQGARDMDELARDLGGLEAALISRVERSRDSVQVDGQRIAEETRRRLEALQDAMSQSLDEAAESIRGLDDMLRKATGEAEDARRALVPLFDELESRLGPLKQAIESVREAARSVGIPF